MDLLKYIDEKLATTLEDEKKALAQYNFVLGYKQALLDFKKTATQSKESEGGESDGN